MTNRKHCHISMPYFIVIIDVPFLGTRQLFWWFLWSPKRPEFVWCWGNGMWFVCRTIEWRGFYSSCCKFVINHVFHYVFFLIWGNYIYIYIVQFLKSVYIYSALWRETPSFCVISTMTYQTTWCHKVENPNITVACIRCCQYSKQFRRSCSVRLLRFPAVFAFKFSTDTKWFPLSTDLNFGKRQK